MGESSYINTNISGAAGMPRTANGSSEEKKPFVFADFSRISKTMRGREGIDWLMLGSVIALVLFGLVMIYSAGPKFAMANGDPTDYFLTRQILWVVVCIPVTWVLSRINYHFYQKISVLMILATVAMLIITNIIGDSTYGANRSLLAGSIRASEVAKLATLLYVSVWLTSKKEQLNDITLGLLPLIVMLGAMGVLIFMQPDFSAAFTVIILGCILFFLAGGELRQIMIVIVVVLLLGWIVLQFYDNGMTRIVDFWAGLHNPLNASYHEQRALEAIVKGGVFGVGIGNGSTKYTGLPVAPTDSIFAVIVEETGLLGAGLVIAAYVVILWRGIDIARRASDQLGTLIASGVTIWILLEAIINMAVMVGLAPQAGNALPFISYGGSSLVSLMAGVGILFSVSRWSSKKAVSGGSNFGAVVDLRWRDRRGRVPRTGRTPGTR